MRLIGVSGIQGSGKTTLIQTLVHRAVRQGRSAAVIVNEDGQTPYGPGFAAATGAVLAYIRGG